MSELKTWEKFVVFIGGIAITVTIAVASIIVMAIPLCLTWNAVIPNVFSLKPITFGQAIILLVLAEVLFKVKITPKMEKERT